MRKNRKKQIGFIKNLPKRKLIFAGVIIFLILLIFTGFFDNGNNSSKTRACTEDAKICPDGSSVGRVSPSCEFAPCPRSDVKVTNSDQSLSDRYLSIAPTSTPTPVPFPDFSREIVKPRTTFDINQWKTFEDTNIGVRLKYPPEWGEPKTEYRKGGNSGWLYYVYFSNSNFSFGGTSSDFAEGREGRIADFNGFGSIHPLWWKSAQDLCNRNSFVFCQIEDNKVHALTGGVCPNGPLLLGVGQRIMFINRPGKTISGLAFGGGFLSYQGYFSGDWFCTEEHTDNTYYIKLFNEALLQRKLDSESMKTFDTYEKVFETVETY